MGKPKAKPRRGTAKTSSVHTKKEVPKYDIEDILNKAEECLDEYKYELAQKFCERALQMDNDNVRALELTSGLLLDMGQIESAQHCLGRAIFLQPDSGHSKYLSLAQLMSGAESRDLFRKGIELINNKLNSVPAADSSICELHRDLSNSYISISEIYMSDLCDLPEAEEEAKSCIQKSVEVDDTNPEAYQAQANYSLVIGDVDTAKCSMDKSLQLWLPDHVAFLEDGSGKETSLSYEFRSTTVKLLLDLEDYDNATKILDCLIEEDDEIVSTWYLLGWTNFLRSKTDSDYCGNARYYLNKAKEINKKEPTNDKEMMEHIKTLLEELGPEEEEEENTNNDEAKVDIFNIEADRAADILDKEGEAADREEQDDDDNEEMMQQ